MTPRALALEALSYIYQGTASATIAAATSAQLARLASDLTATLQEIAASAPDIYKSRTAVLCATPASISVAVTNGSTTITGASLPTIVSGATIEIETDAVPNEVTGTTGGGYTLAAPFSGTTGTRGAVLYADSVLFSLRTARVLKPVMWNESRELIPATNRAELYGRRTSYRDFGFRQPRSRMIGQKRSGLPNMYFVEPFFSISTGTHGMRLRIHPMPSEAGLVSALVRHTAPRYSVADLGSDATDSTAPVPVAEDYIESIVKPIFLKRWSGSPWFRNQEAKQEINDQDQIARAILKEFKPQAFSNRRNVPTF